MVRDGAFRDRIVAFRLVGEKDRVDAAQPPLQRIHFVETLAPVNDAVVDHAPFHLPVSREEPHDVVDVAAVRLVSQGQRRFACACHQHVLLAYHGIDLVVTFRGEKTGRDADVEQENAGQQEISQQQRKRHHGRGREHETQQKQDRQDRFLHDDGQHDMPQRTDRRIAPHVAVAARGEIPRQRGHERAADPSEDDRHESRYFSSKPAKQQNRQQRCQYGKDAVLQQHPS